MTSLVSSINAMESFILPFSPEKLTQLFYNEGG